MVGCSHYAVCVCAFFPLSLPPPPILILGKEAILTVTGAPVVSTGLWQIFSFMEMVSTTKNKNLIALFCQHKMRTWPCPETHHVVIFFTTPVQWWSNKNLKVINWISFSQPKRYSNIHFYQNSKGAINLGILKNWDLIQSRIWSGFSGNNKLELLKLGRLPTFYFAHTTGPSKFYCRRQGYAVRSKTMLN